MKAVLHRFERSVGGKGEKNYDQVTIAEDGRNIQIVGEIVLVTGVNDKGVAAIKLGEGDFVSLEE